MITSNQKMVKVIQTIVQKIVEVYHPEKVILYGSYSYGTPDESSDIDLLIIKETSERPIDRRVTIRKIASPYRKGFAFSPLVLTPTEYQERLKLGDSFFGEINSKGEILYG